MRLVFRLVIAEQAALIGQLRARVEAVVRLHTGDRSAGAIDAGGILPGYAGVIVRDGYHAGYGHLADALHAWCGQHLLRDLKDLYEFEPGKQDWARQVAGPVKVQQRSSGGCWRTIQGLADFALVQSYLSTATKWGLSKRHRLAE